MSLASITDMAVMKMIPIRESVPGCPVSSKLPVGLLSVIQRHKIYITMVIVSGTRTSLQTTELCRATWDSICSVRFGIRKKDKDW